MEYILKTQREILRTGSARKNSTVYKYRDSSETNRTN